MSLHEKEQYNKLLYDRILHVSWTYLLWILQGNADEFAKTKERQVILDAIAEVSPHGLRAKEIAEKLEKNLYTVRNLLAKMVKENDIRLEGYNYYCSERSEDSEDSERSERSEVSLSELEPSSKPHYGSAKPHYGNNSIHRPVEPIESKPHYAHYAHYDTLPSEVQTK